MAHDDEDEEYIDGSIEVLSSVARWVPFTVVFIALGGFLLLGWYAYQAGSQSLNDNELLIVEADDAPIKQKPADPGGMQFPNRDKMIFETFSGKIDEHPKVERIMPEPEEPVAIKTEQATTWISDKAEKKVVAAEKAVKEKPAKLAAVEKKAAPVKKAVEAKAVTKVKAAPKVIPKPKPSVKKGKMYIQLGAYRSRKEAESGWKKIKKRQSRLLSGYGHKVVWADLGAKGIYYRLRVPGFSTMDSARAFCKKLSAKGQACMAIKG